MPPERPSRPAFVTKAVDWSREPKTFISYLLFVLTIGKFHYFTYDHKFLCLKSQPDKQQSGDFDDGMCSFGQPGAQTAKAQTYLDQTVHRFQRLHRKSSKTITFARSDFQRRLEKAVKRRLQLFKSLQCLGSFWQYQKEMYNWISNDFYGFVMITTISLALKIAACQALRQLE